MAQAGLSTLGILLGYNTVATGGAKPSTFKQLDRINEIGGIALETENIDASALEDLVERTVAGRGSTGGTFPITINVTDETINQWTSLITEAENKDCWFEIYVPGLAKAFFIVAQPPKMIPMPEFAQNGLLVCEMVLAINEYKGLDTAIKPTPQVAS